MSMDRPAWRGAPFEEAMARPEFLERARQALARGPLCDGCLGRLFAQVGTGLANAERGRTVRRLLGAAPPAAPCGLCGGLLEQIEAWAARACRAMEGIEFDTFMVTSRADPQLAAREAALWQAAGDETAEPLKQAFNREVGARLCDLLEAEPDLVRPDVVAVADHAAGTVEVQRRPLFVGGRYRKLVRGIPQCRWRAWPTSVQEIIGAPILAAAQGDDHLFHGCGREDVDVRCLGRRPFVLEVVGPRRRRLDWGALAETIARDGRVEVFDLGPCPPARVAELKALRPDKTYRALVHLGEPVAEGDLARLAALAGKIRQRTPRRVARRRSMRTRIRAVRDLAWKVLDERTLELTVRGQAGLYLKELVSGDAGGTRPSVASLLGVAARCAELDVLDIHL